MMVTYICVLPHFLIAQEMITRLGEGHPRLFMQHHIAGKSASFYFVIVLRVDGKSFSD